MDGTANPLWGQSLQPRPRHPGHPLTSESSSDERQAFTSPANRQPSINPTHLTRQPFLGPVVASCGNSLAGTVKHFTQAMDSLPWLGGQTWTNIVKHPFRGCLRTQVIIAARISSCTLKYQRARSRSPELNLSRRVLPWVYTHTVMYHKRVDRRYFRK